MMIKRIREFIALRLAVQPIGSGSDKNFSGDTLRLAALLVMLGIIHGCATVPAHVAAPVPTENGDDHASLAAGRKTYVSLLKCAMCHRPKPVSNYSTEAWTEEILPKMSKKARLSPKEYADVLAYVQSITTQK